MRSDGLVLRPSFEFADARQARLAERQARHELEDRARCIALTNAMNAITKPKTIREELRLGVDYEDR